MTVTTLAKIAEALGKVGASGSFTARRTSATDDLHLEIDGIGQIRFPITRNQAQQLCRIARPARYGQGERTLLDRRVRNTWEVPKSRVNIDQRQWKRTLLPMLEKLRAGLGLPDGTRLTAKFHGMLIYSPGQFFLPHQDSEKTDEMLGTLVVTLPAKFKGGAIVVEHQGIQVTHRATQGPLSFIAFYADCRHEVRPVKSGYRIVLTYDLMRQGDGTEAPSAAATAPAVVDALAKHLREHFATPLPPRRTWEDDGAPMRPPSRLVYLLDHQYTERALSWHRLKGKDAARAAALQAAAESAGCEAVLALAEVHEIWDCAEEGWNEPRYRRRRHWADDEVDPDFGEDEPYSSSADDLTLIDLQDSSIVLQGWIDPKGNLEPVVTHVDPDEVIAATPSKDLQPYASEYEGYMGNYGNTMDRWYRRAAIALWPRERAFAVRAEASPAWALKILEERIRARAVPEAQAMAATLQSFWVTAARHEKRRGFFAAALRVADGLDEPALAAFLLQPFSVEALAPAQARRFVAIVKRYGEDWTRARLSEWSSRPRWQPTQPAERLEWYTSLPRMCEALRQHDVAAGPLAARLLQQDRWRGLNQEIEGWRGLLPPSHRDEELAKLARPILGFLQSTSVVDAAGLQSEAATYFCANENEMLLPLLMLILRAAGKKTTTADTIPPLETIARHCAERIEARLSIPARDPDDWSIALPPGCRCELCARLGAFLANPKEKRLEWPLAEPKRRHIHDRLDRHELPVSHETLRSGRPFTLVLIKLRKLHDRETTDRRSLEADLEWLKSSGQAGSPGGTTAGKRRKRSLDA